MPAKSKKQQRFFALVQAYKRGEIKNPSESVRRAAESMSDEDVRHFAATKHEGLPEKVAGTTVHVHIQNKDVELDFNSMQAAATYLSSIGLHDKDDILASLYNRVGMINGYKITYSGSDEVKEAAMRFLQKRAQDLLLVAPYRNRNADYRAAKISRGFSKPEDAEKQTEEEKERLNERVESDKEDLGILARAIRRVASLLS